MLTSYIDQAMEIAVYEIIEDEGTYWGEIPGLQGVWAHHQTLEGCRRELREALSDCATAAFRATDSGNWGYQSKSAYSVYLKSLIRSDLN